MHIEKNVCDAVVGTLLGLDNKSKDTIKARLDLQDMGIRESLHLEKHGEKFKKHLAYYTTTPPHRRQFFEWTGTTTFPDGYVSNLSRKLKGGKISSLKTHDCHVLLQRLLPVGIRPFLSKEVCDPIVELASFFEQICAKTLKVADLDRLQRDIVVILCKLEQIFPPAFFDIMIHLAVHLPQEAKIAGPVGFRWMFPIERKHIWDEESYDAEKSYIDRMNSIEEEVSNIIRPIEENVNPKTRLCRTDVEPEIVKLSSKDVEQNNKTDDAFIDDNPLNEELPSEDEEIPLLSDEDTDDEENPLLSDEDTDYD